jgi:PST family polysaccharide transporter
VNIPSTAPAPTPAGATECPARESRSYGEILRSSALIGASSGIAISVGIVRTKLMAVLLGPAGFGLMGVYNSIIDLGTSVAGAGVGSSGVRQIAESAASNDRQRIALTTQVLRRMSLLLGLVGAVVLVLLREPIATMTFGNTDHAWAVAALGIAVLCKVVAAGQAALVQGLRRIGDVAMIGLVGAVLGTVASVVLVWLLGDAGIVPALVAAAAAMLAASWWYSRRVRTEPVEPASVAHRTEIAALLKLGLAFMASGFLMMGAGYAVRALVLQHDGAAAAGFYHAAWTVGGMYVGIILQAMGADFYPRLTGAISDRDRTNRLVNEQTEVGLLLAAPGVIATLGFAPLAIMILYSSEFAGATDVLRWICLGMALRVISWPMGYIVLAKGARGVFFATELAWAAVNVGLAAILVPRYGVNGAGFAFFASYAFHVIMIYAVARAMTGFRWSVASGRLGLAFLAMIGTLFTAMYWLDSLFSFVIAAAASIASAVFCARAVARLIDPARIPPPLRRVMVALGVMDAAQRGTGR